MPSCPTPCTRWLGQLGGTVGAAACLQPHGSPHPSPSPPLLPPPSASCRSPSCRLLTQCPQPWKMARSTSSLGHPTVPLHCSPSHPRSGFSSRAGTGITLCPIHPVHRRGPRAQEAASLRPKCRKRHLHAARSGPVAGAGHGTSPRREAATVPDITTGHHLGTAAEQVLTPHQAGQAKGGLLRTES